MQVTKESTPLAGAVGITLFVFFASSIIETHASWVLIRISRILYGMLYIGLLGYTLSFNRFKGDQFYPLVGTGFWLFLVIPFEIIRISWSGEISYLFIYLENIILGIGMLAIPIIYFFRLRNKKKPLVRYEKVKGWLILGLTPLVLLDEIALFLEITILFKGLFSTLAFLSLIAIFFLNDMNLYARKQKNERENYQTLIDELGEPPEA